MSRSARDIPYWLEMAEANACADMISALADAGDPLGAQVDSSSDGVTFALRSIDSGFFNRSVGLGAGRPATKAVVRRILRTFLDARQTSFTIQVSPFARPSAIESWLEATGMRRGSRWAKVWRDTIDPPVERTERRIEAIGREHRAGWNLVTLTAFELPDVLAPFGGATLGRSDCITSSRSTVIRRSGPAPCMSWVMSAGSGSGRHSRAIEARDRRARSLPDAFGQPRISGSSSSSPRPGRSSQIAQIRPTGTCCAPGSGWRIPARTGSSPRHRMRPRPEQIDPGSSRRACGHSEPGGASGRASTKIATSSSGFRVRSGTSASRAG